MKYQQPYGISDPLAPYINGDPSIGRQGSIPPAGAFEENQRELTNWIVLSGMTPSGGDWIAGGDLYQVAKSAQAQKVNFAVDAGTQNAMKAVVQPQLSAYQAGLVVRVQVLLSSLNDATHTTLTLDAGAGPAAVVKPDGSMPATNDLRAGGIYQFVFDNAGRWQLTTVGGPPSGGSTTVNVKIPYCRDSGTVANQIRAIYSPAITAVNEGDFLAVKLAISLVTGACTITINSLAPYNIKHADGNNPALGDAVANQTLLLCFDGTNFQIIGILGMPGFILRPSFACAAPTGGGQYVAYYTPTQITSYSNIIANNMNTSTFISNVLTVGAGEDGLWFFWGNVDYGNVYNTAAFFGGTRIRSGAPNQNFLWDYMTYPGAAFNGLAEANSRGIGMIDLQVGDKVQFNCMWIAPGGGSKQIMPGPNYSPDVWAQIYGQLVSRHLI
jgi:hypothetical protein